MVDKKAKVLHAKNPHTSDGSVRNLLEGYDVEVIECSDGIETIRKAFLQRPDLILLDVDLPRMNGFQCSRLLKQDPFFKSTPVFHIAASGGPIDRFWSKVCRGDCCLTAAVGGEAWEDILRDIDLSENPRHLVGSNAGLIAELDDNGILRMAAGLLEQDLLRATVLNEINRMDTWDMEPGSLVTSLMTIIQSLYPFSRGASLLMSESHNELYVCGREPSDQAALDEIKDLMIHYLWEKHSILLKNNEVASQAVAAPFSETNHDGKSEIYVHTRESGPVQTVLFFENLGIEDLTAKLQKENRIDLVRIIQKAIMRTMRKTDFIARWNGAGFAFLFTHTSLENARNPVIRVQRNIQEDVSVLMPLAGRMIPSIGASELNLAGNETAESFFAAAMPDKAAKKGSSPPAVPPATDAGSQKVMMNEGGK